MVAGWSAGHDAVARYIAQGVAGGAVAARAEPAKKKQCRISKMISIFKPALKSALAKFGYVIAQEHRLPSPQMLFRCLSKKNIAPQLIIDIGVAYGTD